MRIKPRRRTGGRLIALLACFAALAALVVPAAPVDAQGQGFGQGNWRVVFYYQAETVLAGEDVYYTGHGSMFLNVAGTEASGEWNLSLDTVVLSVGAPAHADAVGTIEGPSTRPVLPLDQVTVTEPTIGMTLTFTAEELPPSGIGELLVTGSGCNALTGKWLIPFQDTVLEGEFIAEPLGASEPSPQADLRDEGLALIENARNGVIDSSALAAFVARAEAEAGVATTRRGDCTGETARMYGTSALLLLDAVLKASGYALDGADDDTFVQLYRVALRSGLFDFNPSARITWEFELLQRLADAINDDEPRVWRYWLPVAREFGEVEAEAVLEKNICLETHRADPFYCED